MASRAIVILPAVCCASLLNFSAPVAAQSVEEFYRNTTVSMYVGSGAGGGYDAVARVVARHIGKYIPGKPTIVVKNMPGAGGVTNANYMYSIAPRDGSAIAAPFNTALMLPLFNDPASKFDARGFTWIGSTDKQQGICVTWHSVPVKTIEDARSRQVVAGTTALNATPGTFPFFLNTVLGTKFKIIGGYSTSEMRLALERGEIESICGVAIQTHLAVNPHWFRDDLVNVLVQFGLNKHRILPDAPLAIDLVKNEDDRKLLEFILIPHEFGRPFIAPPGVPADRREALREAFTRMLTDPEFISESERQQQAIDPLSGIEIEQLLQRAYATSPAIIEKAAVILRGPEPDK